MGQLELEAVPRWETGVIGGDIAHHITGSQNTFSGVACLCFLCGKSTLCWFFPASFASHSFDHDSEVIKKAAGLNHEIYSFPP